MTNHFYKFLPLVLIISIVSGCSSAPKKQNQKIISNVPASVPSIELKTQALKNIEGQELDDYVQKKGVIFGKAEFQGVLKTGFVKLLFEHQTDPEKKFQLYVGDQSPKKDSESDIGNSNYFFIELPEGEYKITSVSIPVGSTLATEETNVELDVLPDTIAYVGTFKMNGTKERIKFGGVPFIKPGFDYTLEILDENQEGIKIFQERYPLSKNAIVVHLMHRTIIEEMDSKKILKN